MGSVWRSKHPLTCACSGLLVTLTLAVLVPAALAAPSAGGGGASLTYLIGRYLAHRPGRATVAVYDAVAKRLWLYQPSLRNETASIVKVDILEARLRQTQGHLSSSDRSLAKIMIERSDNNAATALWNEDGGAAGIGRYNGSAGLGCTSLDNSAWGLTLTCARDQIHLLSHLANPNRLLTDSARRYELRLMRHVVSWEAWGVSGGVPHEGVSVALKNGWLPYDSVPWIVNSIGFVHGRGRRYLIAVLTRDPSEQDGINTIEGVSAIVWRHVAFTP